MNTATTSRILAAVPPVTVTQYRHRAPAASQVQTRIACAQGVRLADFPFRKGGRQRNVRLCAGATYAHLTASNAKEAAVKSALHRPVTARGFGIPRQVTIAAFCVAALLMIAALAHATMKQRPVLERAPVSLSAQCEHDGGIALESLAAHGLDVRTPKYRRDRERAIQACRNGFPDFRWLNP